MSADETEQAAATWLGREDRGLTAQERDALKLWLAQSSLNKVAYLRLKAAWQRADRLAALKSPAPVVHGQSGFRPLTLLAIAASIALLLGADAYFTRHAPAGQNYATDIGRMQAVRLADGTQVELNTNTRLHADVTGASRTVRLAPVTTWCMTPAGHSRSMPATGGSPTSAPNSRFSATATMCA